MVIEKIKSRNIADLSTDKVHCCYFDEGNVQIVDVFYTIKAGVRYMLH